MQWQEITHVMCNFKQEHSIEENIAEENKVLSCYNFVINWQPCIIYKWQHTCQQKCPRHMVHLPLSSEPLTKLNHIINGSVLGE